LQAFLKPRLADGKLWFTLDEAIVVARKPGEGRPPHTSSQAARNNIFFCATM
jgi:hypothetical protein